MFKKVLIGIDEETHGRDPVALARQLLRPDTELVFAHVYTAAEEGGVDTGDDAALRGKSTQLLREVAQAWGGPAHIQTIGAPRIGAGLHRLAELTGADLVVIGSSRKGRSGRVFLRDEVGNSLNGAPCALAVAPLDHARSGTPIREVGVAYSGSEESVNAVLVATELSKHMGASVNAFQALPLPVHAHGRDGWDTYTVAVSDREAQARARIAERFGVNASAACGEAIDEIAMFSGSVDLLLAGSRGYGPSGRLVQGSTTLRLLRFARTPLLILARADDDAVAVAGTQARLSRRAA
ncbi:MAG: universal stress protein [Solirubrobacteraceae bacterium]